MIIHKLYVEGYKMIGEPLQLEFPDKGRIGILGQNESGKSTLLESIASTLYGLGKDSVTWGKDKVKLEMEFSSGEQRYILMREIGVTSAHRAKLIPIIDGKKDAENTITNLTEIKRKIEEINGMDKDSFTKLVYIRQKDLDALKELYKSQREQLVNKVMGIEVFDQASQKVKEEISEIEKKLLEKRPELEKVGENKKQYESNLDKKKDFEKEIEDLEPILVEKESNLGHAKEELKMYDWLLRFKSIKDLIGSRESELEQVKSENKRLKELEDRFEMNSSVVRTNEATVVSLQELIPIYQNIENQILGIEQQMREVQTRRNNLIESLGLSKKEVEITTKGLVKEKSRQLRKTGLVTLLGIIGLFAGLISLVLATIGVALLLIASYFFIQYLKIDKLLSRATFVESYNEQVNELQNKLQKTDEQMSTLREQNRFESSKQIVDELRIILTNIKDQTGQETFDGLKAVTESLKKEINLIRDSDPEQRAKNLLGNIQQLQDQIKELVNTKPEIPEGFSYEDAKHKIARELYEESSEEYNQVESVIKTKKELIKQLEDYLGKLKPDFDRYPILDNEVNELDAKANILSKVCFELSETSKELRTKIIPQARYIINQMLPTLTDGRYSDFEITEDLKFKVYSIEAGDYKEREIFSGGTQDQFLIALRLAFTQSILDSRVMADKYSLLMDECISSSDDVRKQGIFEVLEVMKGTFTQIFIIAHEDISNFVDHHIVLARNTKGYTEIRSKSW